jgi:signal transduction histidine kinase/ActR/RegA family two-component response regulator
VTPTAHELHPAHVVLTPDAASVSGTRPPSGLPSTGATPGARTPVDPARLPHAVQFYEAESFLAETVARELADALNAGAACAVFATKRHRDAIDERLRRLGIDVATARARDRYVTMDAAETLAAIVDDGEPDEARFADVVGRSIDRTAHAAPRIHVFGEMVALLVAAGKQEAAVRLERLWNGYLARWRGTVSLLCAYPLQALAQKADGDVLAAVCAEHATVAPAESYATIGDDAERARVIAVLQQKAHALEAEIAQRAAVTGRLEHQIATLRVLYRLVDVTARAPGLGAICEAALDAITEGVGTDRASILLADAQGVMRFSAWRGLSDGYRAAVEGHSPWARDDASPEPIVVPDVLADPALAALAPTITVEGIRSVAFIPIVSQGRLLGKFMLYFDAPHDYTTQELQLSRTIASHVGFAVERARAGGAIEDLLRRERAAREEAERANRAKDEFLATLSHELRTPLNAILGWTTMLRSAALDEATSRRALEVIERNVQNQAQLIADLLDVSRVVTGKMTLDVGRVDLPHIAGLAIDSIRPAAQAKGLTIRSVLDQGIGDLSGDAERLQQVLWNLLSNAVKFTSEGGRVELRLARTPAGVRIVVADTGRGIDRDLLPHLFERFRQGDSSSTREHRGLGLGLAIARHLVELHGGTIRADSDGPECGAAFTVELPSGTVSAALVEPASDRAGPPARMPVESLHGLRILVVDDTADACDMLRAILRHQGAEVTTATSAREALDRLAHAAFDVLLCDVAMPGMNGHELMRTVRTLPRADGHPPAAIAVTAYASAEDVARARASGFDAHMAKPLDLAALIQLIATRARGGTP